MSSVIDSRVVELRFDDSDFKANANDAINSLNDLNRALSDVNLVQPFEILNTAAQNVDLTDIKNSVDDLSDRFSMLGIVAMSVIDNLVDSITGRLASAISSITEKIVQGGFQRAQSIEQARFQLQGMLETEEEVETVLQNASNAVSGTAFTLDAAANAASQFAASGVKAGEEMEQALIGISGVAATTSRDYEEIARIFTTVAGNGRLMGDQLNQLSSKGLSAAAALATYFNKVRDGEIEATASTKALIESLVGAGKAATDASTAISQASTGSYEETKKLTTNEYNLKKKSYDEEYRELQKHLNAEYNAKKAEYDKAYNALSDSLNKELEALQKSNAQQLNNVNNSYQAEVEAYRNKTQAKIDLINEEYLESIKLIDEERYNKIKAIDEQIAAINEEAEAEQKARELAEEEEKRSQLKRAVEQAKFSTTRQKAEEALAAFEAEVARKRAAEQRKENIKELQEEKAKINEEAEEKKKEAAEKQKTAVSQVQDESNARLKEMQKAHQAEIEAIRSQQEESIAVMRESNAERLNELKLQQSSELEALKEAQTKQLEERKEFQNAELEKLREANSVKISEIKDALSEEKKAVSKFQTDAEVTEATIREMVSKGLISFDLFSEAMAATFGEHAFDANKTFRGAMANINAALKKVGEMFWNPIIKEGSPVIDLLNAIRLKIYDVQTSLSPIAEIVTTAILDWVPTLIAGVEKLDLSFDAAQEGAKGTFTFLENLTMIINSLINVITGLGNTIVAVGSYISPVLKAFKDAFEINFESILNGTSIFADFTKSLMATSDVSDAIYNFFSNIFSAMKSITDIASSAFEGLYSVISNVIGNIYELTKSTEIYQYLMGGINSAIQWIISTLEKLSETIKGLVNRTDTNLIEKINSFIDGLKEAWSGLGKFLSPVIDLFKKLSDALWGVVKQIDPIKVFFSLLNGVLLVDTIESLRNISGQLQDAVKVPMNFVKNINANLKKLGTTIDAFTMTINAGALKEIATAVLILAGAMFVLSTVDGDALGRSIAGVTVALVELMAVLKYLEKETGSVEAGTKLSDSLNNTLKAFRTSNIINSIIKISAAVVILSYALKNIGELDWDQLFKGLIGVTLLMGELIVVMQVMDTMDIDKNFKKVGSSIILISVGLLILSEAVKKLGEIDTTQLAKGVVAVGVVLLELAAFAKIAGGSEKMASIGVGMLLVAVAVNSLYNAVAKFGELDTDVIIKGLATLGGILLELGIFAKIAGGSEKMISTSIAMIILAQAVKSLTDGFVVLSELPAENIAKGLIALGGSLTIMVAALLLLSEVPWSILGAASIAVVAASMVTLAKALEMFGDLSVAQIVKGLIAMGGALAEIAVLATLAVFALPGAIAITAISGALIVLAKALEMFGDLSVAQIVKGLIAMGGALAEIVVMSTLAILALPGAVAITALSMAMVPLSQAFKEFGSMSWNEILKGIVAMGAAVTELSVMATVIGLLAPVIITGSVTLAIAGLGLLTACAMLPAATGYILDAVNNLKEIEVGSFSSQIKELANGLGILGPALALFGLTAPVGTAVLFLTAGAIGALVDPIKEFTKIDSEKMKAVFDILAAAFLKFGKSLKEFNLFALAGAASMKNVAEAINILAVPMTLFVALDPLKLSVSFSVLGEAFKTFSASLKSFGLLSGVGASAMLDVAKAVGLLAPALTMLSSVNMDDLSVALTVVATSFASFGESLDNFNIFSEIGAKAMVTVADAVSKLAPALTLLGAIRTDRLIGSIAALGIAFKSFGEALSETPFWGAKTRAEGIGALIDNVAKLTDVLPPFMELDHKEVRLALKNLSYGFKSFAVALSDTPFWGSKSRAEGIGALIDNISKLANELPPFLELDAFAVKIALSTLASGFKGFGEALGSVPFWKPEDKGTAISILVDSVSSLARGLLLFTVLDYKKVSTAIKLITGAFSGFGEALGSAPFWKPEDKGNAIKILVDSITSLSTGLMLFITLNSKKVSQALSTISKAFFDFADVISKTPLWNSTDRAESITVLTGNITLLADGIKEILALKAKSASNALKLISTAFSKFAEAIGDSPLFNSKARAEALTTVVDAIVKLIQPLSDLSTVNSDSVKSTFTGLNDMINSISSALSTGIKDKDGAFVTVINSITNFIKDFDIDKLTNLNTELDNLTSKLQALANINLDPLNNFGESISKVVSAIYTAIASSSYENKDMLYALGADAMTYYGNGISDNIENVTDIIKTLFEQMKKIIDDKTKSAKTYGESFATVFKKGLSNKKDEIVKTTSSLVKSILSEIKEHKNSIYKTGQNVGKEISNGMDSSSVIKALSEAVKIIVEHVTKTIKESNEFYEAGEYVAKGFADGITDNVDYASDAGKALGDAAIDSAKKSLDEHSPSKKMNKIGSYAGAGFVDGLKIWAAKASFLGEDIGDSAIDGMKNAISKITDQIQNDEIISPTITPILDLSNVEQNTKLLNNMLDSTNSTYLAAKAGSTFKGGLDAYIDEIKSSIPKETSNNDILDAISGLREDMFKFVSAVTNMEIVMDTGELVGAIVDPLDRQMGFNTVLVERGVR